LKGGIILIDEKYIIEIKNKRFVLYEGLLVEAHSKGLMCLEVTLIQFPSKENGMCCICRATVIGKDGQNFTDYGDAAISSVDPKIIPHIIRMASTRAKARALRDFTNIGLCSLEEIVLSDLEDEKPEPVTEAQLTLLKKLSKEKHVDINYSSLDKSKASKLISELSQKKVV
jgi:hypothetical protein